MSHAGLTALSLDAIVAEHDRLVGRVNSGELSAVEEEGIMDFICILEMAYLNHSDRPLDGEVYEEAHDA